MAVEIGSDPFRSLAEGAGMDLETVRSLAEGGSLELAVRRYQRRKTASEPARMTGRQAFAALRSRANLTPRQAQVEVMRRKAV